MFASDSHVETKHAIWQENILKSVKFSNYWYMNCKIMAFLWKICHFSLPNNFYLSFQYNYIWCYFSTSSSWFVYYSKPSGQNMEIPIVSLEYTVICYTNKPSDSYVSEMLYAIMFILRYYQKRFVSQVSTDCKERLV